VIDAEKVYSIPSFSLRIFQEKRNTVLLWGKDKRELMIIERREREESVEKQEEKEYRKKKKKKTNIENIVNKIQSYFFLIFLNNQTETRHE
jgi:hypothetical protein